MIQKIIEALETNKNEIIEILKEIETESVATEEFNLSINALKNSDKYIKENAENISSYLPMNLPLYSLIIYTIIPRICAKKSNYRPSTKTLEQSKKIHEILEIEKFNIHLFEGTRFDYFQKEVSRSDVVIFVGKPKNAEKLSNQLSKKTMFIYFGVGQNPVVIENDADIQLACKKIVSAIMFNYGQDCAKPNVILCKKDIYDEFSKKLIAEIEKNMNEKTTIKNLEALKEVAKLLVKDNQYIIYGGNVDFPNRTLNPIIITKPFNDNQDNYDEYYAPIFRIITYNNISELRKYFSHQIYKEENMNVSLFGRSTFVENLPSSLVLPNEMVGEIDNGYCEYGGYGINTSYILYRGIRIIKPILINREISYFLKNERFIATANKGTKILSEKSRLKIVLLEEYKSYIQQLFGNDLSFSFIFGSYAKGKEKLCSDIDIFACLRKYDENLIKKFREWYFQYHYIYGKTPDFYYPGEIITEEKLNQIIRNSNKVQFDLVNDSDTFDALFYTQILTDRKREILGDNDILLKYETEFRKIVPEFCYQIFELLTNKGMIRSERDYTKCLMALSSNNLLFFGKRLTFEKPKDQFADIVEKLDDGFLIKCLKRQQKNNL